MHLVLTYVLVEPVRTLAEILSEVLNDSQVRLDCGSREIAALESFQHTSTLIRHVASLGSHCRGGFTQHGAAHRSVRFVQTPEGFSLLGEKHIGQVPSGKMTDSLASR
jgi:hypothetical protein